jgi:hypothetical protein
MITVLLCLFGGLFNWVFALIALGFGVYWFEQYWPFFLGIGLVVFMVGIINKEPLIIEGFRMLLMIVGGILVGIYVFLGGFCLLFGALHKAAEFGFGILLVLGVGWAISFALGKLSASLDA